jgi:LysM repeat protein
LALFQLHMIKLFFALFVSLASVSVWAFPADSLRIESVNGKFFIIHQIDAKETLYSISRRYGVAVTAILESNPDTKEGIGVGKLLRVPYTPKGKAKTTGSSHLVAAKETLFSIAKQYGISVDDLKKANNLTGNELSLGQTLVIPKKSAITEVPKVAETKSVNGTHTVEAGQTMYSIARQYGLTIDQLKKWNDLQDNELKVGQVLSLRQTKNTTVEQPLEAKRTVVVDNSVQKPVDIIDVKPIDKPVTKPITEPATIRISENVAGSDEVKESGMAELMDGTDGSRKYLALHRTAKAGSILKVRNEANNKEVFVRVMGPLASDGTGSATVIKISKSAFYRLGAETTFKAEVTYYK